MTNDTRTRSRESSANGRPSLLEKTYSRVSHYGHKGAANAKDQVTRVTSRNGSLQTAVETTPLRAFTGVFRAPEEGCRPKPPAKLTESQEKLLAEMLVYFRGRERFPVSLKTRETRPEEPPSDWEKLRMLTRESMLRYLRATKWDVNAAKKRLTESIAWRREFGVDSIDPYDVEEEAKSGKETVMGYDKSARPLHYMHPHRNNTKESPRQMQFAVWILEACIDLMPPGVEQLALLINFDSRSRNPTSIANAKLMLYILQNHYVERLGVALCINVPWIFKAFWNAIQSFIDPVTKSKCKFDEGIKDEVPLSQLSREYGGELESTYHHEQYWPDLVRLTKMRREMMLKRFQEQCNSEIGASEWVIRGGNDAQEEVNLKKADIDAVVKEADHKAALARTDSGKPAEAPTTQVSDPPQVQDVDNAQSCRQDAVDASNARVAYALSRPSLDVAPTPSPSHTATEIQETFKTPSADINSNPLDRTFSTLSMGASAVTVAAPTTNAMKDVTSANLEQATLTGKMNDNESSISPVSRSDSPSSTTRGRKDGDSRRGSGLFASISKIIPHDAHRKSTDNLKSVMNSGSSSRGRAASKGASSYINILFFAAARDAAGTSTLRIPLTATPLGLSEIPALIHQSKGIKDPSRLMDVISRSNWSVDQVMIDTEDTAKTQLKGGEDVAVIPPVSGG